MVSTPLLLALAAGSMAVRDMLGTLLVVAEARGRAWLAGTLDALGDVAAVAVTVTAAGPVLARGLDRRSVAVLAVMCITSFLGTALWTRVGQRMGGAS